MEWIDYLVFSLLGLGVLFALARLIIGPHLSDRMVSLDTLNMIVIGIIVLLASFLKNSLYLDIAMVYAVLAFLETVVFARYLEAKKDEHHE